MNGIDTVTTILCTFLIVISLWVVASEIMDLGKVLKRIANKEPIIIRNIYHEGVKVVQSNDENE